MDSSEPRTGGILDSLRRVGETVFATFQNRLQLFVVEWQEEKLRAIQAVLWLALGLILIFLGLAVGVATLAVWVYLQWGWGGLIGLTLLLLLAGSLVLVVMWNRVKSQGLPFSETVNELRKDREWLKPKR